MKQKILFLITSVLLNSLAIKAQEKEYIEYQYEKDGTVWGMDKDSSWHELRDYPKDPKGQISNQKGFVDTVFSKENFDSKEVYCLLLGTSKFLSNTVTIQVDFGQGINKWRPKDSVLRDEESGAVAKFNSMVDALNYMAKRGWKFVNAYAITTGNQNVYHWLLKKEISN